MSKTTITENISENPPKRKRGRPRSSRRDFVESKEFKPLAPDGCTRTKTNFAHSLALVSIYSDASEDDQRALIGNTEAEIGAGKASPRWGVAAIEIGRYLESVGETEENRADVLSVILDARTRGLSWGIIGNHFRKMRLGEREGSAHALTKCIARAIDDFCRRFSATTQKTQIAALENILSIVKGECE